MELKNRIKLIEERVEFLYGRLEKCDICPRNCKVNRLKGKKGYCGAGRDLVVYTAFLHQGEEPVITGKNGSGTIFFSGCNLKCSYCQNYKFSHFLIGKVVDDAGLAKIMLNLQAKGAENINLVTPTHFLPQILKALVTALKEGLKIPIVYNTSGYEKREIIAQIKGIIDIYLTDFKYNAQLTAQTYSNAPDYPIICQESVKEMYSHNLPLWDGDLLKKGLIIRHLAIPGHTNESKSILSWVKENTPKALISVMSQYQPYFKAVNYPKINRVLKLSEYRQIKSFSEDLELQGWVQDLIPEEKLAGVHFKPQV
ncbi:MAG: radical SAM protein [Candidatus Omnitrophica bacterium]|nr:radical SAM protein [Candidatus Omnitrophota bacterium]